MNKGIESWDNVLLLESVAGLAWKEFWEKLGWRGGKDR